MIFARRRESPFRVICTVDLDESDLESESRDPNDDEKRIAEKAGEDVSFAVNLASVHLVEKGHLEEELSLARWGRAKPTEINSA